LDPPASRNAPCPCGSGRRYKACHGALEAGAGDPADVARSLREALEAQTAGRLEVAEALYREALARSPRHFDALHMLGLVRHQRGDSAEAADLVGRAVALFAGHAPAHSNLGLALLALQRPDEALASFDRALALQPAFVEAIANRGNALVRLLRHDEAIAAFEAALALAPERADVWSNLGNALLEARRYPQAVSAFERVVALDPGYDWALGSLATARLHCCDWRDLDGLRAGVLDAVREGRRVIAPFALLGLADAPDEQRKCAALYAEESAALTPLPGRSPRAAQRVRLGYLSSDFRDHAMGYLVADFLATHDRTRFEVVGFSHGPRTGTEARRRIERACDEFHDVRDLDDAGAAARMRERGIDIAVDLNGWTLGARPGVLARRPAPVQVHYLGYPGTMAASWIDYALVDGCVVPPGAERHFGEAVVRLPDSYFASDRARPLPVDVPSRRDAGLPDAGFVFACFNNSYKLGPATFDIWTRLLAAVEGSVLWLLQDHDAAVANLREETRRRGVDPDRLRFAPREPLARHIARHPLIDLFLDTLPYNAHTTASDALWAGVPVITCPGASMASRVAASLLHAVDLPELVTGDLAAYEALALALARDPARLARLRRHLVERRAHLRLFDAPRFCLALERAYDGMWERALRGERPVSFDVPG
jgi:predicted O-linked N-acetylglucosamine transferase (SPINDLY family)